MKSASILIFFIVFSFASFAQSAKQGVGHRDSTQKLMHVETACGQCQLGLKGKGCSLAVRIKGKSYFVDGADIDAFGDAHASDGFCNAIREADVQGAIVNDRFKATYFSLATTAAKKN
jgi:hypothetical protein